MRQLLQQPTRLKPTNEGIVSNYVWLRTPPRGASLAPKFTGPYKVTNVRWPNLALDIGGKEYVTNVDRTAPAYNVKPTQPGPMQDKGAYRDYEDADVHTTYTQEQLAQMQPEVQVDRMEGTHSHQKESRYGRPVIPFNRWA